MSNLQSEKIEFAKGMRSFYSSLNPTAGEPDSLFSVENVQIPIKNGTHSIQGRVYQPTKEPESGLFPLVLFSHGGCLVSGDLETHDVLVRALALRLNAVVLSYDYSLAPEQNALEQMEEAQSALEWLHTHATALKGNVNKLIGIGDSAGGQITANLAHIFKNDAEIKFKAVWLMYPVLSINLQTESFKKLEDKYFPSSEVMRMGSLCFMPEGTSDKDARILPLFADHKNIAPTLISVGELDPLYSDSFEYIADLKIANITHELKFYLKSEHGFIQYFKNKDAHALGEQALEEGVAQLKQWIA